MANTNLDPAVFLRGRVNTLEEVAASLQAVVASLQASGQRNDGLEARVARLEEELKASRQALDDSLARNATQADELKAATKLIDQLAERLSSLEGRLETCSGDDLDINADARSKRKRLASTLEDQTTRMEADVSDLKSFAQQCERNMKSLESSNDVKTKQYEELKAKLDEVQSKAEFLQEDYENKGERLDDAVDELATQAAFAKDLETRIEELKKGVAAKAKEFDELQDHYDELHGNINFLEGYCERRAQRIAGGVDALEKNVVTKGEQIDKLKSEAQALSVTVINLRHNYENTAASNKASIASLEDRCESQTALTEGLKVKVEALEESLINTTHHLEESFGCRAKALEERLDCHESFVEERMVETEDLDDLEHELRELEYKIRCNEESIESTGDKADLYHGEWQKIKKGVEELKKANATHSAERLDKLEKETKATFDAMRKDVGAIKKAVGIGGEQAMAGGVESLDE